MTTARLALSLVRLRAEMDTVAPRRSKASDGWIGNAAHAARPSDHNPDSRGIVHAIDITDDDAHGADMAKLAHYITTVSRDKRIKYLIHDKRIYSSRPVTSSGTPAWAARPYSGTNAHEHHLHVSVVDGPLADDASTWRVADAYRPSKPAAPRQLISRTLGPGAHGTDVKVVQRILKVAVDGAYGPRTHAAVIAWQRRHGLPDDGLVGPKTASRMGLRWAGH